MVNPDVHGYIETLNHRKTIRKMQKKQQPNSFINTKKAFKKLYILILRHFGLILIHLQSKK